MVAPEEKRRKLEKSSIKKVRRSRIFQPFRAIGYITTDVPFVVENHGQDFFLTTSVGKNFQMYNLAKMNLLFVSTPVDENITALAASSKATYVAHGNSIGIYKRGKEVARIVGTGEYSIIQILVLGQYVAALCDDNVLRMWNAYTSESYAEIDFGENFTATAMIHPSTYLNKILVASTQGTMQIWNVRTSKMIYQFSSFKSAITCLVQSPVVDVVAVGLMDGTTVLYNIKMDEKLFSVWQEDRVTAISFRTDEEQMMATGNMHGDVALWDLAKRKLAHIIKGAHSGLISSVAFLHNQPVLVTAGSDNAVKQWLFEKNNSVPRVWKSRSGHFAPPSKIRYYGEDGKLIISAGRDHSLRGFSTIRDEQNFEFSQGHVEKQMKKGAKMEDVKLPLIVDFTASTAKEKDWDNLITCHMNDNGSRTWRTRHKTIGAHTLISQDKSAIKVTNISACGNFGFIGTTSGQIDMFNLQSGLYRKSFGGANGHKKAITGLASDNANRRLISASVDRTIKIWDFKSAELLHTIQMEAPIAGIRYHQDNELLAVATDDLCISVIDIETQKVVREFWGHRNRITDFTFTNDGRWIVSASLDATIRTWDLPTSTMIDIFKVDEVVTSLTFSPTGDFLATSHVDSVGIFLWANRTQFANIPLHSITDDEIAQTLSLPSLNVADNIDDDDEEELEPAAIEEHLQTAEQLSDSLISLSLEPKAKWQNLLNLETIKKRNKPKEAPKAPEKAPFFLPTLPGAIPKFAVEEEKQNNEQKEIESRRLNFANIDTETAFVKALRNCHDKNRDYTSFVDLAKSMGPSSIDVEVRTLPLDGDLTVHNYFVEAILFILRSRKNFELAQTWLTVFLNIHGDVIISNPENDIHDKLQETLVLQKEEFGRLSEQIHYGLCLIDFARK
ncbi:hypothetical protein VTP01DRAFT_899 [Rhizomucor pusillus]|uniref:uncharacterized protein n=1 Tax=Rhizomucor pusillus TaxID=4840 RepID=UPI003743D829